MQAGTLSALVFSNDGLFYLMGTEIAVLYEPAEDFV